MSRISNILANLDSILLDEAPLPKQDVKDGLSTSCNGTIDDYGHGLTDR